MADLWRSSSVASNKKMGRKQSLACVASRASMDWLNFTKSLGSSTTNIAPRPLPRKCIRCSPRYMPRPGPSQQLHDFEMTHWQLTFDAMGGLRHAQLPEAPPSDVLSDVPYHCSAYGRTFEAKFGELNSVRAIPVPEKRLIKSSKCQQLSIHNLPAARPLSKPDVLSQKILQGGQGPLPKYLPKSSVRVRLLGRSKLGRELTSADICLLMWKFGPVLFTISEGKNSLVTTFEFISSAYSAVNARNLPQGMTVTWCYDQFNNFGHYNLHKDYAVSNDKVWTQGLTRFAGRGQTDPTSDRTNKKSERRASKKKLTFDSP
ncbi:uncharacterized protein LOC101851439 [Aplysia californica]|uniref:Uncharacterized protein LOC101851439 n=1 Tax=Aplysia californica TaxID=6500 RepID=A0ABM1A8Z9_APLCA|nr:uncharacterized protein LOC101851439 [Aplysia californica]